SGGISVVAPAVQRARRLHLHIHLIGLPAQDRRESIDGLLISTHVPEDGGQTRFQHESFLNRHREVARVASAQQLLISRNRLVVVRSGGGRIGRAGGKRSAQVGVRLRGPAQYGQVPTRAHRALQKFGKGP